MKKSNLFFALALYAVTSFLPLGGQRGSCQNIGINTTGASPNASALLDIDASPGNDKGLLIPRLTTTQMNGIASPATGLIIYNTDCNSINYYNGVTWVALGNTGSVATPGAITGSTTPCQNATGVAYSITAVSGATGYNWTVPTGASVATGQGSTSITVDFATTDGNICVTASNACGTSNASCTAITLQTAPAAPTATAASNIAQTSFDANWNASAGTTTYYLDVATDAGFTSFVTGYNNLNVGNVVIYSVNTNLTCATTYYYRVRAGNSCGTSANSNTITVTTTACCPSLTENFVSYTTQVAADAAWVPQDITKYRVDITNDEMDFAPTQIQSNQAIAWDFGVLLGGPLSNQFVVRMTLDVKVVNIGTSGTTHISYMQIGNIPSTANSTTTGYDHMGIYAYVYSGGSARYYFTAGDNDCPECGTSSPASTHQIQVETLYVQISRNGTAGSMSLYSDPAYSTLIETLNVTVPLTSTGYTTLWCGNRYNPNPTDHYQSGSIKKIEICNGVTSW